MPSDDTSGQLIDPERTWNHSPQGAREESVYRLPRSEVLAFLTKQTSFMQASSSPANNASRKVIYEEQYPHLHGAIEPLGPATDWSAEDVDRKITTFVSQYSAEHLDGRFVKVGYTPVLEDHVYVDGELTLPHAIVLGLPMRYDETNAAPESKAGEEVTRNYMELGGLTLALGGWLRKNGYAAELHHPRGDKEMNCEALFIPHAIAAGFGELGRHGSMISREFGPRIRLSMITTDAPIPKAQRQDHGVDEFCTWCNKCMTACPVDAIPDEREMLRGSYRFVVDTTACLPYFAQTDGCGICIAVCPYNKADEAASEKLVDQVLSLDWVKQAAKVKQTNGIKAMEQYIADHRAARRSRPE